MYHPHCYLTQTSYYFIHENFAYMNGDAENWFNGFHVLDWICYHIYKLVYEKKMNNGWLDHDFQICDTNLCFYHQNPSLSYLELKSPQTCVELDRIAILGLFECSFLFFLKLFWPIFLKPNNSFFFAWFQIAYLLMKLLDFIRVLFSSYSLMFPGHYCLFRLATKNKIFCNMINL